MAVDITPNGTRGANVPKLPRPLRKLVFGIMTPLLRLRGAKILTLVTTGAKSGRTHEVDLGWFPEANNWIIVASLAGAAKHPAWLYNMARNPDKIWIKVDGRTVHVQAESLRGDERAQKYAEIAKLAPGYATYQEQTDREIPVIRLTAVPTLR